MRIFALQVYVIVFGMTIAGVDVWRQCEGSGFHYRATTAGLIAVFSVSFILQSGMVIAGSKGDLQIP